MEKQKKKQKGHYEVTDISAFSNVYLEKQTSKENKTTQDRKQKKFTENFGYAPENRRKPQIIFPPFIVSRRFPFITDGTRSYFP